MVSVLPNHFSCLFLYVTAQYYTLIDGLLVLVLHHFSVLSVCCSLGNREIVKREERETKVAGLCELGFNVRVRGSKGSC